MATSLNRHGYGNDDRAFEDFRREKYKRRRDHQIVTGETGAVFRMASETLRVIEAGEQREARELRLTREMFEFVRDTTKLAAGVLTDVNDKEEQVRSVQIAGEMREFFKTALGGTGDLMSILKQRYGDDVADLPQAELEAHMAQLGVEALDRYRSEGSEDAARLHLGEALPCEEELLTQPVVAEPKQVVEAEVCSESLDDDAIGELHVDDDEACLGVDESLGCLDDPIELGVGEICENYIDASDAPESAPVPVAFAKLLEDPAMRKRVLAVLARADLLTKDEAREIFIAAKELKAVAFAMSD